MRRPGFLSGVDSTRPGFSGTLGGRRSKFLKARRRYRAWQAEHPEEAEARAAQRWDKRQKWLKRHPAG